MSAKKEKDTQKFFTLIFCDADEEKTTKVPSKKGKTLKEAVESVLENHGISLESHSFFLGASNTPLPISSDSFLYGGATLYIRENVKIDVDKRIMTLMRNDSEAVGRKISTSTMNFMKSDGSKKSDSLNILRSEKRTISENLAIESTKRFSELLENFDPNAGDPFDSVDGFTNGDGGVTETDELWLEDNWTDIINETEEMSHRVKIQQQAIWELFTTEVGFIKDVKVIIDVFQKCFRHLQDGGYLTEVKEELIFANIEDVYHVNVAFWKGLLEVIEETRRTKNVILPSQLLPAFDGFEELFQPYIEFCNADTSNMHLPDYLPSTSDKIKQWITWCDNHELCKRITIAGFLIKPLQRVTKYSLLLKAILNKTDDDDEKIIVEEIRQRVETFVSKINSAIHLRQEQEKLDNVVSRLFDYSPVEPVNDEAERITKEYCDMNFKGSIPGLSDKEKRFILMEGPMKLLEKHGKKDVYAFLFTDVFIITKLKRNVDKYRIIRPMLRLNKIVVRNLKDPGQLLFVYLNEYGVLSNALVCHVEVSEQEKWRLAIEKAKASYEQARNEYGLREDFWDDDSPSSPVTKSKLLKRQKALRKVPAQTSTDSAESLPDSPLPVVDGGRLEMVYKWDHTLTLVGVVMFITANAMMNRLLGYFGVW